MKEQKYAFCRTCWKHLYGDSVEAHSGHDVRTSSHWAAPKKETK